mmetsp:Transcript_38913/g.76495  ORF Transcript_38913/g.76495 Transcript_38913/m.76495 type:complete len:168 (+) Transcript_38913:3791-4294(+)
MGAAREKQREGDGLMVVVKNCSHCPTAEQRVGRCGMEGRSVMSSVLQQPPLSLCLGFQERRECSESNIRSKERERRDCRKDRSEGLPFEYTQAVFLSFFPSSFLSSRAYMPVQLERRDLLFGTAFYAQTPFHRSSSQTDKQADRQTIGSMQRHDVRIRSGSNQLCFA